MSSEDKEEVTYIDVTSKEEIKRIFGTENPSYDDMRKYAKKYYQGLLEKINGSLKSRWVWGNRRSMLLMFKGTVEMIALDQDNILELYGYVDKLNHAVLSLNDTMQRNQGKTSKELAAFSKLDKDVEQLKDITGPKITAVIQFFANLQKETEQRKKNGEGMVV